LPGVLRLAPGDHHEAARLLLEAAPDATSEWGTDAVTAALLVLVRGGLAVQASLLGPFDWSRSGVRARGAKGDPWRQRLRGASRGGDGFFSTFAVRPLSRRLTAVGLSRGWSPNAVTAVSLVLGLVAAVLVATGLRWAWALAAVLLLAALVVDCVDGEIARFTRRFSPLGAFLDAVGDRVKEYAVVAAVAAVAVRDGQPGWPLAVAVLAAVTVRHLEDYAYEHRLGFARRSRPELLPVDEPRDRGAAGARTTLPEQPGPRARAIHWAKKVIHLPIAERYLLLSLTLLTGRPMLVLWTLFVAVCVAVLWTQGGRVVAVLLRRDPYWAAVTRGTGPGHLDHQLDLGPLARAVSRLGRAGFPVGLLGAGLLAVLVPLLLWRDEGAAALGAAAVGAALVGLGWQPPVHHPLAWQAPAALWVAEAAVVGLVVHHVLAAMSAAAFAYLSAIAYHRYDVVYRLRDTATPPAAWLSLVGGGTEGRILLVLALALVVPEAVVPVLWGLAVVLAALYLGESAWGWRRWIASQARRGAVVRA
jgi:phosphatidylglycerophosphate synthase